MFPKIIQTDFFRWGLTRHTETAGEMQGTPGRCAIPSTSGLHIMGWGPRGDTPLCLRGKCRLAGQRGPQIMGVQSGREKGFSLGASGGNPCFPLSKGHEEGTGRGAPSLGAGASKQDKEGEAGGELPHSS